MANNRLWLLHRSTKRAMMLGKRMGTGWYNPPPPEKMQAFFDFIEEKSFGDMDDFELLIEDNERVTNPSARDKWTYDDFEVWKESR